MALSLSPNLQTSLRFVLAKLTDSATLQRAHRCGINQEKTNCKLLSHSLASRSQILGSLSNIPPRWLAHLDEFPCFHELLAAYSEVHHQDQILNINHMYSTALCARLRALWWFYCTDSLIFQHLHYIKETVVSYMTTWWQSFSFCLYGA